MELRLIKSNSRISAGPHPRDCGEEEVSPRGAGEVQVRAGAPGRGAQGGREGVGGAEQEHHHHP